MKTKHLLPVAIFLIGLPRFLITATAVFGNSTNTIAGTIRSGPSLPSECDPGSSKAFFRTTGPRAGLYECTSRNTWTALSATGTARKTSAGTSKAQDTVDLQAPRLTARASPVPIPAPGLTPASPAQSGSTFTPAGSSAQFQFNNAGAFGGTSNLTYASSTGAVTLNQLANGNETLYGTRTTDTSPTGNLIHFQNYAKTADLFKVDTSGNVTAASFTSTVSGPFVMSGAEGACSGAAAGKDVLCLGDSISHAPQLSLNNGTFYQLPHFGASVAGSKCLQSSGTDGTIAETAGACGGAPAFSAITSGTNTTAAMVIDTGASVALTGTATVDLSAASGAAAFKVPVQAGAVPTAAGALAYDSTQGKPVIGDGTLTLGIPRTICAIVPTADTLTASVIGANTETNFASHCTIPAGTMIANKVLEVRVGFQQVSSAATIPGVTFKVGLTGGGKTIATPLYTSGKQTFANGNLTRGFSSVISIGGTAVAGASVKTNTSGVIEVLGGVHATSYNQTAQPVAWATNVQQILGISITFGNNTAGNTVRLLSLVVQEIN